MKDFEGIPSLPPSPLAEENAKLREELAERDKLLEAKHYYNGGIGARQLREIDALKQRAEAAEAKLKAASEQKPVDVVGYMNLIIDQIKSCTFGVATPEIIRQLQLHAERMRPVYFKPIPPVDVQVDNEYIKLLQQQRVKHEERIAELERKLAEQQVRLTALLQSVYYCQKEHSYFHDDDCARVKDIGGFTELNTLLAQAREEGRKEAVPDGWQVVPKEANFKMIGAGSIAKSDGEFMKNIYAAMLAVAPTPGEPTCNPHPDAPHGFDRNASHQQGWYVCECEGWTPGEK